MIRLLAFLAVACLTCSLRATASPLGPDGAPDQRLAGKFVWFDLATEDPDASRAFYGAVFGWKFREVKGAAVPYTLIEGPGGKVGGMFRHERPAGGKGGARWLALISADPEEAERAVRERGGEVLLKTKRIPGRGRHAVFRDPDGAVFGVLANEGGDPADTAVVDGDFFWVDLFTHDVAKAASFYSALAPYEVDQADIAGRPRTFLSTNRIARAGIAHLTAVADKPGWLPYVLVDDVPSTLERARRAGGKIVVAPRAQILDGNVAVIADPQGGLIGVVNWVETGGGK